MGLRRFCMLLVLQVVAPHCGFASEPDLPRTSWDAPDLNGFWNFGSLTPLERPEAFADKSHFTPQQARSFVANFQQFVDRQFQASEGVDGQQVWEEYGDALEEDLRTSLIINPSNGKIPDMTSAAQARWDARNEERMSYHGPEALDASERCITGENPPILSGPESNYLHLFQTRDHVALLTEFIHDARIVPLDGRAHLPAHLRQWNGNSRALWDGDTLVVESRGFRNEFGIAGIGRNVVLSERFTLVDRTRLHYELTVDDPATFVSSWTMATTMRRTDKVVYEYACHEHNYSMQGILGAARLQERLTESHSGD